MISFAETGWEVISLVLVFLGGIILLLRICRFFGVPAVAGLQLYLWHSLFCTLYLFYSLSNPADSLKYYLDSLNWNSGPMPGGRSVLFINALLTQVVGLSYGGCFFIFNIFGSIGLVAFYGALLESNQLRSAQIRRMIYLLPFFPGFSFWSTAIGKDSIAFLGVGLIAWSIASPYRRFFTIMLGLVVLGMVRPHIASFALIALVIAYSFTSEGKIFAKLLMNAILVPAAISLAALSVNYVGLEEGLSTGQIASYVEQRQSYNLQGGSSVDIANAPFLSRIFLYIFRPLFFDANSVLGIIVSFENLFLLLIFVASAYFYHKHRSSLSRFQKIFLFIYVTITWVALANTTANLGIAIRQKTMFTPLLIILLLGYFPQRRISQD